MEIRSVVAERYGQLERCYGHCEQPATLKFLNADGKQVIAGYSCHMAYLSRIIIYSDSLDLHESRDTIGGLVGKDQEVKEEDVRIASRYPWDFDITTGDGQKLMMVAYWTQNYRRTKSEEPNRTALFLCEGCRAIFSQPLSERQVLCSGCRSSRSPGP
jgi:protein-arginine kinase activator protein McsA